jgi:hydroxypyruvate isomerase
MKRLEKAIKYGYKVVIWGVFSEEKDINDMIKSGKTKEQITNYILNNSYSGTTALIKFKRWKKV